MQLDEDRDRFRSVGVLATTSTMAEKGPTEEFRTLWGARVLWPSDMPDDLLEAAVSCTIKQLEGY